MSSCCEVTGFVLAGQAQGDGGEKASYKTASAEPCSFLLAEDGWEELILRDVALSHWC